MLSEEAQDLKHSGPEEALLKHLIHISCNDKHLQHWQHQTICLWLYNEKSKMYFQLRKKSHENIFIFYTWLFQFYKPVHFSLICCCISYSLPWESPTSHLPEHGNVWVKRKIMVGKQQQGKKKHLRRLHSLFNLKEIKS